MSKIPATRGPVKPNASLKELTWFKVGGAADYLFTPEDEEDLVQFLKNLSAEIPVTILGLASNTIVRDGGIEGVVIRLGKNFSKITVDGNIITAGAAAVDAQVARAALNAKLTGVEFMSGIPGSVGGGLRMNAGAYGREFKDVVIEGTAIDRSGNRHVLTNKDFGFSYRHSAVPEDWIFTSCKLQAVAGDEAAIRAKMDEIKSSREGSQPIRSYTGGSTFANPEGHKAWQLIDAAGCRGLTVGGAQVSTQHCNFLINNGTATAADIENLGEAVREAVLKNSGISLRWEIKRIGKK